MKFQDSSFNGLKVTVGTKSVTHAPTHTPKAICPIYFFKVGGIMILTRETQKHIHLEKIYPVQLQKATGFNFQLTDYI